jgi:hypothetical protein
MWLKRNNQKKKLDCGNEEENPGQHYVQRNEESESKNVVYVNQEPTLYSGLSVYVANK